MSERSEQRDEEGRGHREGEVLEELSADPLNEGNGQKDRDGGERRGGDGHSHLAGAVHGDRGDPVVQRTAAGDLIASNPCW